MNTVGQRERITQNRVVNLFRQLGYTYLGNWETRAHNRNIEPILAIAKIKVINFAGLDFCLDISYYEIYCRYWEAVKICQQLLTAISV